MEAIMARKQKEALDTLEGMGANRKSVKFIHN